MKKSTTKRALFLSFVSMFLCFTMLLGTTYAWFTDSVTSGTNTIVSGNLDVELYNELYNGVSLTNEKKVNENTKLFDGIQLWEPGAAVYENFTVANLGNLALKYRFSVNISNKQGTKNLADVLKVAVVENGIVDGLTREAVIDSVNDDDWMPFASFFEIGSLLPGEKDIYGVVIWWEPSDKDNDYNMNFIDPNTGSKSQLSIDIGVDLFATQLEHELDSFDNKYDSEAPLPGSDVAPAPGPEEAGVNLQIRGENEEKIGSAFIPSGAVDPNAKQIKMTFTPSDYEGNFTIAAGHETLVYDIEAEGIKEGNTEPIQMGIRIPAGIDPSTVKAYHYDNELEKVYDPSSGYVYFKTADFSPFTVAYDAESVYIPPVANEMTIPTATVTYEPDYVGADKIDWYSFAGFAPTPGLDSNLEAAFSFKCPETLSEEVRAKYETWYCDFYVSLDRNLGANQIFLGGYYDFVGNWVGFHNGDITLTANEEIGLLTSVTTNPWTYEMIEEFVGEFKCGVGDVDDALEGATFKVMLRLTNPENEAEYYNVNTVTYTFGGNANIDGTTVVTTGQGLQDSINNGDTNITLGGDIDLGSGGIVIP